MKIYVASSWNNNIQSTVIMMLREIGHEVYDFRHPDGNDSGFQWSEIDENWQKWTPDIYRHKLNHPLVVSGFKKDFKAMEWAECGLLVMPCGRSAHLEAGYFVGVKKPLYILICDGEPELMYKMATRIFINIQELKEFMSTI